jgi:hypothetical protein
MLTDGKHKPGSVKMGYYALKFLFCNIFHKDWAKEYLPTPKVAKTLPLVLSKKEVEDVLSVIPNFKHRTIIMFIYSTGARVSECVNIKLNDIDSSRMQVNIQEGKGLKQRKVPLSAVLLNLLRRYYRKEKPGVYLFEGYRKGCHISVNAVREICKKARYRTPHIKNCQLGITTLYLPFRTNLMPCACRTRKPCTGCCLKLYQKQWVVNVQKPMGKPERILEYLSRYVFRIAITDRRIIEVKDGKVLFSWKDYRTGRFHRMKLEVDEFIRRFLLHLLPKGFFKVRYYGIFSSRYRKENIETARELLAAETANADEEALEDGLRLLQKQDTVWDEISQ